jgi:hypothetical protein
MARLIATADSLYWIAGSLVVIGGFFLFVASMIKHLWDSSVERRARSMRHVYNFNTNVDIYNIFFDERSSPELLEGLPLSQTAPLRALDVPLDLDDIEPLLWKLLRSEGGALDVTGAELRADWSTSQLSASHLLCTRAVEAGVSPQMRARCEEAMELLEKALTYPNRGD